MLGSLRSAPMLPLSTPEENYVDIPDFPEGVLYYSLIDREPLCQRTY